MNLIFFQCVQCVRKVRELIEKYFFHIFFLLHLAKYFSLNDTISQNMKSKARPPREHVRVQIQTLAKEGITPKEIAKKLKVGRTTVFKWKGKSTVSDKKRSGRLKILSSADKKQIKSEMYQKLGSYVRKTTKIPSLSKRNRDQGKKIGKSTVYDYLKTTD